MPTISSAPAPTGAPPPRSADKAGPVETPQEEAVVSPESDAEFEPSGEAPVEDDGQQRAALTASLEESIAQDPEAEADVPEGEVTPGRGRPALTEAAEPTTQEVRIRFVDAGEDQTTGAFASAAEGETQTNVTVAGDRETVEAAFNNLTQAQADTQATETTADDEALGEAVVIASQGNDDLDVAVASAEDGSNAIAVIGAESDASALATGDSSAVASAQDGSLAFADADDGAQSLAQGRRDSTALADAEGQGAITTSVANDQAESSSVAEGEQSLTETYAEFDSTAVATSADGGISTAVAGDGSIAFSTAEQDAVAGAEAAAGGGAQALAFNEGEATARTFMGEAVARAADGAVAETGVAGASTATTEAGDEGSLASVTIVGDGQEQEAEATGGGSFVTAINPQGEANPPVETVLTPAIEASLDDPTFDDELIGEVVLNLTPDQIRRLNEGSLDDFLASAEPDETLDPQDVETLEEAGIEVPQGDISLNPVNPGDAEQIRIALVDDFVAEEGEFNHGETMAGIIQSGGAITQGAINSEAPNIEIERFEVDVPGEVRVESIANATDEVVRQVANGEEFDAVNLSQQANFVDPFTIRTNANTTRLQNQFDVPVAAAAGNNGPDVPNTLATGAAVVVENAEFGTETRAAGSGEGNLTSEGVFTCQATANVTARAGQLQDLGFNPDEVATLLQTEAFVEGGALDAPENNPVFT